MTNKIRKTNNRNISKHKINWMHHLLTNETLLGEKIKCLKYYIIFSITITFSQLCILRMRAKEVSTQIFQME